MRKSTPVLTVLLLGVALWLVFSKKPESTMGKDGSEANKERITSSSSDEDRAKNRKRDQEEQQEIIMGQAIRQINIPIEFWGKVVDHHGEPLEGVDIRYRIQQPRVIWDSNSIVRNIVTDTNGDFHISGDKGSSFSFEAFGKFGYKRIKGQKVAFTYSDSSERYTPDKSTPKIYTLIKDGEIQGLIHFSRQLLLDWDGVPRRYNLRTGKFSPAGEIQITALRGEIEGEGREARYDWLFRVEALNGGVLETTREDAHLASMSEYRSFWEYGRTSTDQKWSFTRKCTTYLCFRLAEGNYGRLEIRFSAETGSKISGRISSYLNPSGGRVLEYDAQRRIK